MMRPRLAQHTISIIAATLVLCACGGNSGNAAGAVSEGEAEALEEAAEMLDERRLPDGALPEVTPPQSAEEEPQEVQQ